MAHLLLTPLRDPPALPMNARYVMISLLVSVLPAPLSPLTCTCRRLRPPHAVASLQHSRLHLVQRAEYTCLERLETLDQDRQGYFWT